MTRSNHPERPTQPEVWLRGSLPDIPGLLNPVAHALMQAREEVDAVMQNFPEERLWIRPGGVASVGFHLQHLAGVMDRLFTYARGEQLSSMQLESLKREGSGAMSVRSLLDTFHLQVERSLAELRAIDEHTLMLPRKVGRRELPSTVLGLLVHAAEHTQRHVGQLLVTVRVQR
jgi:uncharacterized damage-inducible protein DinB